MSDSAYTLLIDHIPGETRWAVLRDDILTNLHIDRAGTTQARANVQIGDIYKGRVVNIVASLQAAFVDIGGDQNAFLPVSATFADDISKAFHQGEQILVQVRQTPQGDKGAVLTCKIDLNADDCVLTPNRPGINVSRKFKDTDKRSAFKALLTDHLPDDCGLIVRTSAENQEPDAILHQAQSLISQWASIESSQDKAPSLLLAAQGFLESQWDRYKHLCFDRIIVEGLSAYQEMQRLTEQTEFHNDARLLFEAEGVESQIEEAAHKTVALPGGGNIVIEPTTALIAVDVNMAERTDNRNLDENHLRTNLAALDVLADQMVLRNLSGQILIDFISLKNKNHKHKLEQAVHQKLKDKRTTFHGLTKLGLGEVSRKRKGTDLPSLLNAPENTFYALLRQLSKGTTHRRVSLGSHLYAIWMAHPPTWLSDRLGFDLKPIEDKTLKPLAYRLEE
ncbi:ribonuclease E/G [Terasakiella sp. A23]|uniref:ribonuclease E/G n=1 Tax=Terasakiella sp. FCG-A23 TaxID=3080561 RepID=UPI002953E16C|nr:ribonuclease E/G [Terasakiella sp. A23]MDV7341334.1 ribonuclease E/G [Terasakiella sp. A23]